MTHSDPAASGPEPQRPKPTGQAEPEASGRPSSRGRTVRTLLLRVGVTVGALTWTLSQITWEELADAFQRMTMLGAGAAAGLTALNLVVGAFRWRLLLTAYGAQRPPKVRRLVRLYWVGLFYNTFLPANVGGDLVRGYVTRAAFDEGAGAYLIVAVERVFGLAGLLLLCASVLVVRPLGESAYLPWLAAAGLAAAVAAAGGPMVARRIAPALPGRLKTLAKLLPPVRRPAFLLVVLALSVVTHTVVALSGHALVASTAATVALSESLVLVPLALVAMYFPTVAGLGAREAAFVVLFGSIGVAEADAMAASLGLFGVQLLVALVGGLLHLVAPLPAIAPAGREATGHP